MLEDTRTETQNENVKINHNFQYHKNNYSYLILPQGFSYKENVTLTLLIHLG
jgi:hypothetical protein